MTDSATGKGCWGATAEPKPYVSRNGVYLPCLVDKWAAHLLGLLDAEQRCVKATQRTMAGTQMCPQRHLVKL